MKVKEEGPAVDEDDQDWQTADPKGEDHGRQAAGLKGKDHRGQAVSLKPKKEDHGRQTADPLRRTPKRCVICYAAAGNVQEVRKLSKVREKQSFVAVAGPGFKGGELAVSLPF